MSLEVGMSIDLIKIQLPITETLLVGEDISDSAEFEWLDTELMKVGSLAHESIEWDKIKDLSWKLLTEKSKDYRLLSFLIQSLQQKPEFKYYLQSIAVLHLFLDRYWQAFPYEKDGKRVDLNRTRFLVPLLKRSIQRFDEYRTTVSTVQKRELLNTLNKIALIFEKQGIEIDDLEYFIRISEQVEATHSLEVAGNHPHDNNLSTLNNRAGSHGSSHGSSHNSAGIYDSIFAFFKAENDIKFIHKLIAQLEKNEEFLLALIMRRIALWDDIHEVPLHESNGETTLAAPSQEVIGRSQQLLSSETFSLDSWLQLENSLMRAPFWLDAHRISAFVAGSLFSKVYEIEIKQRVNTLLDRLPVLKKLTFSNGMKYISEETLEWLQEDNALLSNSNHSVESENIVNDQGFYDLKLWNNYLQETDQYYKAEGFTQTLHWVQQKIQKAENLREEVLWQLALSQLYKREGLSELAQRNNQAVIYQITHIDLQEWEPQIFEFLQHGASSKEIILE